MLHALYRDMCTEGGRSRDGCPIGDLWAALYRDVPWAALYRDVPCYMLYTETSALREAKAVMHGCPMGEWWLGLGLGLGQGQG